VIYPGPLPFNSSSAGLVRSTLAEHGFARVTQVFSPCEVDLLRRAFDELVANPPHQVGLTWRSPATSGESVVQRISRANLFSASIAEQFMSATQLFELGSWIFNVSADQISVANGNEGSDGIVLVIKDSRNQSIHRDLRWHRDTTFSQHLPINPFVNAGLYLDYSDASRGGLLVLPGSHRSTDYDVVQETTVEVPEQVCISAEPGDVVIHNADLWHRSGPHSVQGEVRRVLYANLYAR
jgi:ectoine hydroxylase-related dioxygenase (phytanoyl-CoA dioxygenase family)